MALSTANGPIAHVSRPAAPEIAKPRAAEVARPRPAEHAVKPDPTD